MLPNIKLYLRSIKRTKLTFAINLIGLSTGLACTFLICLWIRDEMSVDKFHANDDRLGQVMLWYQVAGSSVTSAVTPGPLAEDLPKSIAGVQKAAAVLNSIRINTLSVRDNAFKAKGIYASKDFFEIFSFEPQEGSKAQLLTNQSSIVITEAMALKLFGTTQNVVGKTVEFDKKEQFIVSGVLKEQPVKSTIEFDFALALPIFEKHTGIKLSWEEFMASTYVLMADKADIATINAQILKWLESAGQDTKLMRLFVRKFSEGYLHGNYENGVQTGGRIEYVKIFSVIGAIILLIACINFVSLSTAMASNRMKEVAIKKVMGSRRGPIIAQHLGESIMLSCISLLVALCMVLALLPSFNDLTDKQISLMPDLAMIGAFLGIALVTGVLAGLYPAFHISRFEPGIILRDNLAGSFGAQWIRKGLTVMQFAISVVFVLVTLVVYNQFSMIQNRNFGYDKDGIIYFDMDGKVIEHREAFLDDLRKLKGVQGASSIYALSTNSGFFGSDGSTGHLNWPGKNPEESISMNYRAVDYGMMELMKMQIKEGRTFSKAFRSTTGEIIFNETAIKLMNLKGNPVGTTVEVWKDKYTIIGIVKDFYFESINAGKVKPMFLIRDDSKVNTVMVKVSAGNLGGTLSGIESFHGRFNPGFPFVYKFLDQDFQKLYATERKISILSTYFAGLAILISCLGLYGLTAFTVAKRKREISTRIVWGASRVQILMLLYKDISKLILVGLLIGLPVGYALSSNWLDGFAEKIKLEPWFFILAGGMSFFFMVVAAGVQIRKAMKVNLAESLKTE